MSVTQSRKVSADLELARRIRAAGVAIFIQEDDEPAVQRLSNGLRIKQFGGLVESHAFDFYGAAGIVCWLRITTLRPALAISSFDLQLPWKTRVQWLEQYSVDGTHWSYQFGGQNSLGFEVQQVLNRFADLRVHERGASMQGCLAGISTRPIPESFVHGAKIPATVVISDQFNNRYASAVSLWADRSQKMSTAKQKPRRGSLFECPDPKPLNRSSHEDAQVVENPTVE